MEEAAARGHRGKKGSSDAVEPLRSLFFFLNSERGKLLASWELS